jgi:hypothetical protein
MSTPAKPTAMRELPSGPLVQAQSPATTPGDCRAGGCPDAGRPASPSHRRCLGCLPGRWIGRVGCHDALLIRLLADTEISAVRPPGAHKTTGQALVLTIDTGRRNGVVPGGRRLCHAGVDRRGGHPLRRVRSWRRRVDGWPSDVPWAGGPEYPRRAAGVTPGAGARTDVGLMSSGTAAAVAQVIARLRRCAGGGSRRRVLSW